ncbi:MAG: hypothetical protein AAF090_16035 [Bacteroidota bacterium]
MICKKVLFYALLVIAFAACKSDDSDPQVIGATSFSGIVVFQDTQQPFVGGEIGITGFEGSFPIADIISSQFQDIGNDGRFQISFEGDESIDSFVITIFDVSNGTTTPTFSDFNCGSLDCNDIEPGRAYSDITIELIR